MEYLPPCFLCPPPLSMANLEPCELLPIRDPETSGRRIFWSSCNSEMHCVHPGRSATATAGDDKTKTKILNLLRLLPCPFPSREFGLKTVVQFWGIVKIGDKKYLTTCDQPFSVQYLYAGDRLCEYRKQCLNYLIPVDDDEIGVDQALLGPPGRVFRNGVPESASDLHDYTSEEYPQRNYAVWGRAYWALPVYHPTQHLPCGVLEIVSSSFTIFAGVFQERFRETLKEVGLKTTILSLNEVSSCQDGEIAKIDQALKEIKERHEVEYAGAWRTSGEILIESSFDSDWFPNQGTGCWIRKGQGVIGKAFSSKNACFCRDVRHLSVAEYPLVVDARSFRYCGCFAVCLQSCCLNNCIYVLEFFLPQENVDDEDPRTLLDMLIETLKKHLKNSFKIASGQELGQKLSVEVIKVSPMDKFEFIEICSGFDIESTPRLVELQGGEGMMELNFSSQQADATNGCITGIREQPNGSLGSIPRQAKVQREGEIVQPYFSSKQVHVADDSMNRIHEHQNGIVGSLPRMEHEHGFVTMSNQGLVGEEFNALARVDAANNSMNSVHEQKNGTSGSSTEHELVQNTFSSAYHEPITKINVLNSSGKGVSIEQRAKEATKLKNQMLSCTLQSQLRITREDLEQYSTMKLDDAANALEVSRSTLKRMCREHAIPRWPPRKARKVNPASTKQRVVQPLTEKVEEHHQPDATRLEDDNSMWVKAKYQGDMIKFELPFSACKIHLEEEIAQRFDLAMGSFKIKYLDEDNDWITITRDDDLRTLRSTLILPGRNTIKMLVS